MSRSLYYAALVAALLLGTTAIGPAISHPRVCSNAPKSFTPCPHPNLPVQPLVPNPG
jgi:hypothetical protein